MALIVAGALAVAGCGSSIASPSQSLTAQQVTATLAKHIPAVTRNCVHGEHGPKPSSRKTWWVCVKDSLH
jgi:hypothetical protein